MSSSNLRVSSVKTTDTVKKKSEIRAAIVTLPANFKSSQTIIETFVTAQSIPDQINHIKNIYQSTDISIEDKLEFLCQLFFNSSLKHPVRSQCCKLIKECKDEEELVRNKLESAITDLLTCTDISQSSCEEVNYAIGSISGCFENFIIAKGALQIHTEEFLNFIDQSIEKYLKEISMDNSLSVKNELYLFLHTSVRVILLLIQEFPKEFGNTTMLSKINALKDVGLLMIRDNYMPMDIKCNVGILLAYIAETCGTFKSWVDQIIAYKHGSDEIYFENCFELCSFIGIINTLKFLDLEESINEIRSIINKICALVNEYTTEPSFLLAGSRSLFQLSKTVIKHKNVSDSILIHECTESLLKYASGYMDHHMDSVRHIAKDLLNNILIIAQKYDLQKLLNKVYYFATNEEVSLAVRCIFISNILKVYGPDELLNKAFPNILDTFFSDENFSRDVSVPNCLETLMTVSHKQMELKCWQDLFIQFLLQRHCESSSQENKDAYETLLNKSIKFSPESAQYILTNSTELNIKLAVLSTLRKNGQNKNDLDSLINTEDLTRAVLSFSDDIKLSAMKLFAETNKSTEELQKWECDVFLLCLKYNLNCQSPSVRQKVLTLSMKVITRLDTNLKRVLKAGRHETQCRNLHFYFVFLRDLIDLLFENLFIEANFSRRMLAVELMKKSLTIVCDNKLSFSNYFPRNGLNQIFLFLSDSYESVKALALDILKIIFDQNLGKIIAHHSVISHLITSIKPIDSITASYYLQFFVYTYKAEELIQVFRIEGITDQPRYKNVEFCALKMIIHILNSGLASAEVSILEAAVNNPLYGCLLLIKDILLKLDFNMLAEEEIWRNLINDILILNKEASKIVAPVVNSTSPEGYFPHDAVIESINIGGVKPTPQLVLICAWRTIKEVSLILGDLALRSPIENKMLDKQVYLLTIEQILEIGDHFKLMLSETKHRGAFEQCYVGFTKLCSKLWCVDQSELNSLPKKWLLELIDIISNDEKSNEKICATRRSAGLPYMIQAIITAELQVGTATSLKECMQLLFEICNNPVSSTESKTHSLNILRALFRCTDLNEICSEYIADGIICAIRGYNGSSWSERNSSTLLFASLIVRIFGVPRNKDADSLSLRNKMTGRIFFVRYPKLFDFILAELKEANRQIMNNEKCCKLHPLLLVLSRLYPSALEGTESHLKISLFIEYISPCSASRELQTRILIAKSIVAFTSIDMIPERIYTLLSTIQIELSRDNGIDINYLHGLLLQILYLLRSLREKKTALIEDIFRDLLYYEGVLQLNAIIMSTVLDIFFELFKCNDLHCNDIVEKLKNFSNCSKYTDDTYSRYYPIFRRKFCVFRLYVDLLPSKDLKAQTYWEKQFGSEKNIFASSFEESQAYLNILLVLLFTGTSNTENFLEEFEIQKYELEYFDSLSDHFRTESVQYLIQSSLLESNIENILEISKNNPCAINPEIVFKVFAILSQLKISVRLNFKELLDYAELYVDLDHSIAMIIDSLLRKTELRFEENSTMLLKYLREIAEPWNSFQLRYTASQILEYFSEHFEQSIKQSDANFIVSFSYIVFLLLMDDDAEVRENASTFVLKICPEYTLKYDSVVPNFAQHIFIKRLIEQNSSWSNQNVAFVRKILNSIISMLQDDEGSADATTKTEIFDKNEVNVFAEPRKVALDCSKIFYETFRQKL